MKKSKVPLKYIIGKYCNDDTFYEQMEWEGYVAKKLKKKIRSKDTIDPIVVVDLEKIYRTWSEKDDIHKYAVQDGSHRLRLIKDIAKEEGTFLTALIDVYVIDDYEKYKNENEDEKLL